MKTVKLIGVINVSKLDKHFASSMVDVAYIDHVDNDIVTLLLEDGIDLENLEDRKWILDLVNQVLKKCDENLAKVEIG